MDLQIHVDVVDKDPDDGAEEEVDTLYTSLHVIPPVSDIVITLSGRTTWVILASSTEGENESMHQINNIILK